MNIAYVKDGGRVPGIAPHPPRQVFPLRAEPQQKGRDHRRQILQRQLDDRHAVAALASQARRQKGNESGNPYVDVNQVLAIWRESARREEREKWLIIDPPRKTASCNVADVKSLIPLQDPYGMRFAPAGGSVALAAFAGSGQRAICTTGGRGRQSVRP